MDSSSAVRAALEESEARYRHLVESASDGIYRINVHGYFLYANPVSARILAGGESLVGRHYLEFVRQDFHDDIKQFYYRQVHDRTPVTYYEFPAVTSDGSDLWIGQRVHTEVDADGQIRALHAVARDITDRKRLEDELRQSDKMRVVGQLARGIAHDFNSLLATIGGFADLLTEALGPDDPRAADAVEIRRATDKAAQLTTQLLAFSRRELFKPRILDLNEVIHNIEPMIAHLLGPGITYETDLAPELSDLRADVAQLEQILLNFALNARDAMPDGGTFRIHTENVYVDTTSAHTPNLYPGPYVLLTVSDTGAGMDAETRERAFEPFFTTKGRDLGTGLGLATTYGVVTQAGGRITADSTPGQGTTFHIYLPQARSSATYQMPARGLPSGVEGKVILVADDDEGVRGVLTHVLHTNGYYVIPAINGVDALAKAKAFPGKIDILLADLVMPQLGGFELADAFLSERPKTEVLFMSGYVDGRALDDRGGAKVKLLHKPFDSQTMLDEIETVLHKRARSGAEASA